MSLDPRFLRPSRGVERSGVQRSRKYRLVVAAVVVLMAAAVGFSVLAYRFITHPDRFRVREIIVQGAEFSDVEEVKAEVLELTNSNVLLVDLDEVCRRIEQLPWIETAKARKVLPDSLQLSLVERVPTVLVLMDGDDQIHLADNTGLMIDKLRPEHPFTNLPIVRGVAQLSIGETSELASIAASLLEELKRQRPDWHDRISEVNVYQPDRLYVILNDSNTPILVGDKDLTERLGKYFSIEASLKQRYDNPEYIDVRFDRRLYVKPASGERNGQTP